MFRKSVKSKLLLMILVPVVLFGLFSFLYTIPNIKQDLLHEKQIQTKDMVDISVTLLDYYYKMQLSGALTEEEAQSQAIEAVKALRFGATQDDYYWINDFHPRIVMHPFRPDLEGEDVSGVLDREGLALFVEFVRVAQSEGAGYVPYYWQYYSDTERTEPKLSYVASFEPWQWIIGTGIYINDVNEVYNERRLIIGGLVVFIILISMLSSYIMAEKFIIEPIKTVSEVGSYMAKGDFSCTIPNKLINKQDEFGTLGQVFINVKNSMSQVLNQIKDSSHNVASASTELMASADETSRATNNMAQEIQIIADGTQNQVESSQETAKAMEEMASGVGKVAETSTTIADAAQNMVSKSTIGQRAVAEAITKIDEIDKDTLKSSEVIRMLVDDSEKISNFIQIIENISQQTNLLALNAAIEAARAGEAGKGFAVVAEEIRKLADQTSNSTKEIYNLVDNIKHNTQNAVSAMDSNRDKVTSGTEVIRQVEVIFQEIIEQIQGVSTEVQELAAISEQMSAGAQEISASTLELNSIANGSANSIQNIAAVSEEQLAAMEEVANSANLLSDMADDLNNLIEKFKT